MISILSSVPSLDAVFLCEFLCPVDVASSNRVDLDFGVTLCRCDKSRRRDPGSSQDAKL